MNTRIGARTVASGAVQPTPCPTPEQTEPPRVVDTMERGIGRAFEKHEPRRTQLYAAHRDQLFASDRSQIDAAFEGVTRGLYSGPWVDDQYAMPDILADFAHYYESHPAGSPACVADLLRYSGHNSTASRPREDFAAVSPMCAIAIAKLVNAMPPHMQPKDADGSVLSLALDAFVAVLTRPRIHPAETAYVLTHALALGVSEMPHGIRGLLPRELYSAKTADLCFAACEKLTLANRERLQPEIIAHFGEPSPAESPIALGDNPLEVVRYHRERGTLHGSVLRELERGGLSVRYADHNESYDPWPGPGLVVEVRRAANASLFAMLDRSELAAAMKSAGVARVHFISPTDPKRFGIYAGPDAAGVHGYHHGQDKSGYGQMTTSGGEPSVAGLMDQDIGVRFKTTPLGLRLQTMLDRS